MALTVPRVPVITRSEWGAKRATHPAQPLGPARGIVVHHTAQGYGYASKAGVSEADGNRALLAVQSSHLQRGFSDTGYHFVIDGAGRVYQGREYVRPGSFGSGRTAPGLALGSHVAGFNTGRIGVNLLGCFGGGPKDKGCDDVPSEAAMDALTALLTALCLAYGVKPGNVVGHKDLASTACPGRHLYARLSNLRAAVASAVGHAR
ncbi:MAG TPA: N-acetylmuramoyl-L-alanine amidase [Rubricoccaceae bacterium]|jgi:hypothetical protein